MKGTPEEFLEHIPPDRIRENLMGRVEEKVGTHPPGDFSEGTHIADIEFWTKQIADVDQSGNPALPTSVSPIFAPEEAVRWYAENVVLKFVCEPLPEAGFGSNSNAAAQAVANRASERGMVPLPIGPAFDYPGASLWTEVQFGSVP